jgi:hypothetical protein
VSPSTLRPLLYRALPPAAALLTLTAGLAPAHAASAPSWRISEVITGTTDLQALATSGPSNAIAAGTTTSSLVVQQWNGSAWRPITPPPAFVNLPSGGVNVEAAGTSSPGNTWLFPEAGVHTNTQYALDWTSSAWTVFKLSAKNTVLATAVFSSTDVWAFGARPGSGTSGGFGPAWVLHYDGSAWQPVTAPGTPVEVSAASATDIWAAGPSAASVNKPTQVNIAMHWDGSSWHKLALPKLTPVGGQPWVPAAIVARSARDVWLQETVAVNRGTGFAPPGVTLLHWNGTTWAQAAQDLKHTYDPGLTADSHGGFWLTSTSQNQQVTHIVHDASAHWRRQLPPTEPGFINAVGGFVLIPGTTSVWGTGILTSTSGPATEADIVKYGP